MRPRAGSLWLLTGAFLAGCTVGGAEADEDGLLDLNVEVNRENVLRADLSFTSTATARATVEVLDAEGWGYRINTPETDAGSQVVPLLGLAPDTTYTVEVTAGGRAGSTTISTASLPDDMPPIEVEADPEAMTPGLTLFDVIPLRLGGAGEDAPATDDGYLIAVDSRGRVVWYYRQTHSIQDARRTAAGDILFIHHETGVKSLDLIDGSVQEWSGTTGLDTAPEDPHGRDYAGSQAIRVETDQMHHEVIELPNGNLMTLSREMREISGFAEDWCDEGDEFHGSYQVVADTVVEFTPEEGTVVSEWSLFDLVDPMDYLDIIRPSEFCSQYLSDMYPEQNARDWTHANAVVLDVERNALLVSARHLDQVLAIRYEDDENGPAGELLWRLGPDGDFTLSEGEWFLHQHSPQVLEDGTIMIYDNGNERPGTSLEDPENLPYSRAVQYAIDTENWTAEQVWEHRLDTPGNAVYAPFVGDADVLTDRTVLITHGGQLDPPAHSPRTEGVVAWGQIVEVESETGNVVFDLHVKDPGRTSSWIIYRAERIPTIYPAGYTVEVISG